MRTTHDGMSVTAGEFDALVADLVATLDRFSVPDAEKGELLSALAPMRADAFSVNSARAASRSAADRTDCSSCIHWPEKV